MSYALIELVVALGLLVKVVLGMRGDVIDVPSTARVQYMYMHTAHLIKFAHLL